MRNNSQYQKATTGRVETAAAAAARTTTIAAATRTVATGTRQN
jgi:hypothetical protein